MKVGNFVLIEQLSLLEFLAIGIDESIDDSSLWSHCCAEKVFLVIFPMNKVVDLIIKIGSRLLLI